MSKVLVLGSQGQLGQELKALAKDTFIYLNRADLDLSNFKEVENYFNQNSYDVIINCAAYTAVDMAEQEMETANRVNHEFVKLISEISKKHHTKLIHISTDYVFDGHHYTPYCEDDTTNPQTVYGKTKRDGELAMLSINPQNSIIIRTSWVYSSFGNNFVKTMLKLAKDRDTLGVIYDQVGTPTYAKDLAQVIIDIYLQINNQVVEIYHYSNEGACSWYDFAQSIFDYEGITCKVNALQTYEYPTPATRPAYSILHKYKIKKAFNVTVPHWQKSLKECLDLLKKEIK